MTIDPNQTRATLRRRSRLQIGQWLVDFVMCWIALCGFVNVVFGVASFKFGVGLQLFGARVATTEDRFRYIASYAALSIAGFVYMLWRSRWQFRLVTAAHLAIFWCGVYAAVWLGQFHYTLLSVATAAILTLPLFYYCICWATQRQLPYQPPEILEPESPSMTLPASNTESDC